MKVTLPVGVPLPEVAVRTVAVKVTAWPKTAGLAEETTLVGRGGRVDDLRQGRAGRAGGEIAVAAVNGRDAVGTNRQRRSC